MRVMRFCARGMAVTERSHDRGVGHREMLGAGTAGLSMPTSPRRCPPTATWIGSMSTRTQLSQPSAPATSRPTRRRSGRCAGWRSARLSRGGERRDSHVRPPHRPVRHSGRRFVHNHVGRRRHSSHRGLGGCTRAAPCLGDIGRAGSAVMLFIIRVVSGAHPVDAAGTGSGQSASPGAWKSSLRPSCGNAYAREDGRFEF